MRLHFFLRCMLLLPLIVVTQAEELAASSAGAVPVVTSETVNARLKEVEASTDLDETTKGTLTSLLTKTLGNLEAVRSNDVATDRGEHQVNARLAV
jgi:hypothetical protein